MKKIYVFVLVALVVSGVLSAVIFFQPPESPAIQDPRSVIDPNNIPGFDDLRVQLNIKVLDSEGNVKAERSHDDDLLTQNFWTNIQALFDGSGTQTNVEYRFQEYDDDYVYPYIRASDSTPSIDGYYSSSEGWGWNAMIGGGTTSPAVGDYWLEDPWGARYQPLSVDYNQTTGNLTAIYSVPVYVADDLSEICLVKIACVTGSTQSYFMMARDTFTPVSVVPGDTCYATYTFILDGTGFTDNFGEYLEKAIDGDDSSGVQTCSFIDWNGAGISVYLGGYNTANHFWDTGCYSGVMVGTGSTAMELDDYDLESPVVDDDYELFNLPDIVADKPQASAAFVFDDSYTLREVGWFYQCKDTSGTVRTILLYREVFPNYSVNNGDGLSVLIRVE